MVANPVHWRNLKESDLMLRLALEIKEALLRAEIFACF